MNAAMEPDLNALLAQDPAPAGLYLLIDRSQHDPLLGLWDGPVPEQAIHPLRDLLFEAAPERAPALLDPAAWPDMSSRLRLSWLQNMLWAYDRTINSLSEYYLSGWLLADAPAAEVADHLSRLLPQQHPSGELRHLRVYDPQVFHLLIEKLPAEQRRALLGPVRHWWYSAKAKQLAVVSADPAQRPPPGGFLLPDHTWHWLEILPDILLMRYLLPLLQDAAEGRLPARELDLDRAAAWLDLARARGWTRAGDEAAGYAVLLELLGPDDAEHPALLALLEVCRAPDYPAGLYNYLIFQFQSQDWPRVLDIIRPRRHRNFRS